MYFQPLIIMSILFGVWGMTMTINLLKDVLDKHSMQGKFLVLQLVLLFAKLQALLTRIAVWVGLMPCKPPITPMVYGNCKCIIFFNLNIHDCIFSGAQHFDVS